jgi:solute:Na+ symporter, SSS family
MLLTFVIIYWLVSIGIGLYAALRVHNTKDFAVASRALPFHIVVATVFATWFGSEAVLGIPATFLQDGLGGVLADPFGSSLCLVIVGLFFAKPLYRLNLLTVGDYYRLRFGRTVEIITTLCIVISYLGWVAAQIKALGLVFYVLSQGTISPASAAAFNEFFGGLPLIVDGAISQEFGMALGAASVLIYTLFGGMWSVAITDFIQMIVIVVGLIYLGWDVGNMAGGVTTVVAHAAAAGKFQFWPDFNLNAIVLFIGTLITMMFGSVPQQDVFQRVQSSANENIAVKATVLGAILYFCFTFIPMFLAYCATLIAPDLVAQYMDTDSQLILPKLLLEKAPLFAQVMFFGALLSAIKSCASATLLAPSVTFAENLLRPILLRTWPALTDKQFLRWMQAVVLVFTMVVTTRAMNTKLSIYGLVENAYKVTLVAAFVPLALGVYWKRSTTQGAVVSMVLGLASWVTLEVAAPAWSEVWLPHFVGFLVSLVSFVAFSLLPQRVGTPPIPQPGGVHHAHAHPPVATQTPHRQGGV